MRAAHKTADRAVDQIVESINVLGELAAVGSGPSESAERCRLIGILLGNLHTVRALVWDLESEIEKEGRHAS